MPRAKKAQPEVQITPPLPTLPPVLEVQSLISDNLGGRTLDPSLLERITLPSGGGLSFTLPTLEGEEDLRSFDAVMLYYTTQRTYWSSPFTGEDKLPDCSSMDGVTGVGNPGGACHECHYSLWHSHVLDKAAPNGPVRPSGSNAKACKETRTVFLLRPGELLPLALSVPPSSLTPFGQYVQRLSRGRLRYSAVLTRFSLLRVKNDSGIEYARLHLAVADYLDDAEAHWMGEYGALLRGVLEAQGPTLETVEQTVEEHEEVAAD